MKLGTKLKIGFTLPAVMLLTAGAWSFFRFDGLARDVDSMLLENDRSIAAANEMVLALERMDSGSLLYAGGQAEDARRIIATADSSFAAAMAFARGNMTIASEPAIVDSLQSLYGVFRTCLADMEEQPAFERYGDRVLPAFLAAKHMAGRLRRVNQVEMEARAVLIGKRAYRASLPSGVLALAALVFTALFAWLTHTYVVEPVRQLARRVNRYADIGEYGGPALRTGDEIQDLDEALDKAFFRLKNETRTK